MSRVNARTRNRHQPAYVLWRLGAVTVTVTEDACQGCGRSNLALRYASKRRRDGGEVVLCHLCIKDITEHHRDYRALRKPGAT